MGTVYLGRLQSSADFARTVAIKRPLPELSRAPELRDSIRREARVAARVRHPNVVATLDVAEVEGELWVVMEYVHGPSLATLFALASERRQPIPRDVALALVAGALRGLDAVHGARDEQGAPLGIVHRDLSPHNILCGADGLARIADFGLARAEAMTSITHSVRFKGKLAYASPEQADELPLTPASDLFSCGVILWELLTGRRLYAGATATEIVARLLTADAPAPSSLQPGVPPALDAVVLRALEREPKRRYSTASEMLEALRQSQEMASVDAVAGWLRETARDWMAERERLVAEAEQGSRAAPRASERGTAARAAAGASSARDPSGVPSSLERAIAPRALLRAAGLAAGLSMAWFGADVLLTRERGGPEIVHSASIEALMAGASEVPDASLGVPFAPDASVGFSDGDRVVVEQRGVSRDPAKRDRAVRGGVPRGSATEEAARDDGVTRGNAPEAAVTGARAGAAKPVPARTRATPPAGPVACDPPYSVDAEGIRHMRPGCE